MAVVEMQVHIHCHGCEKKIRRALRKLKGIHDINIDVAAQKVTVMGFVEQREILRAVRKTGILAQPWPHQYNNNVYNVSVDNYYVQPVYGQSHTNSYRLNARHSYVDTQLMSYSEMVMDQPISMFSDDNVNACSVM